MPLLKLSGIGKIYYSEGNVAVGIRGVDLSFERGEFVAVTGASGSGKSTLLNVISGMDSYEEGELYIEDAPTSHFLESDWEEYRSKYISFIFQDYNILESYTVLQNVELALMHIKNRRERRKRAIELLSRVGMEKHLRQKGSKLSGGQKQRTVIARALAKDSPIILADEPTGNLDEATSKEIIELLREVSEDKLLIVVTHNFEEVESCATRHIRIFDGSVEFDRGEKPAGEPVREKKKFNYVPPKRKKFNFREFSSDLKDGTVLGSQVFTSRPKLAVFSCLLMLVGMLGVFFMTAVCFNRDIIELNEYNMFEYEEGRLVVVRRDGKKPEASEIDAAAKKYGAQRAVYCDYLYDSPITIDTVFTAGRRYYYSDSEAVDGFAHDISDFSGSYDGALPERSGEVLLRLPIYCKPAYEDAELGKTTVYIDGFSYTLTGISYYYDNNDDAVAYLTSPDLEALTAVRYLRDQSIQMCILGIVGEGFDQYYTDMNDCAFSTEINGKIYPMKSFGGADMNKFDSVAVTVGDYSVDIPKENIITELPESLESSDVYVSYYIGADIITELARQYTEDNYSQFSLIFENDAQAKRASEGLLSEGYIAVMSNSEYTPDAFEGFAFGYLLFNMLFIWGIGLLCLALFISLCQSRAIVSFKNDIAIMRSMGIKADTIKISMYMRSVFAMIPALLSLGLTAHFIYTTPQLNGLFTYLYGWQYALICFGMILIAIVVARKQQSKLFADSVKKTLTGGQLND